MPCKLVVLGTGNDAYMQLLVAAIRRHGLSDRIHFLGFDPDAASQLRWADLLLLPSIAYESFGMVILEAMIHSKPVICSDFGGMKEVVNHNETGLVTPAGDAAALARAIDSMLTDPERAKAMGAPVGAGSNACSV